MISVRRYTRVAALWALGIALMAGVSRISSAQSVIVTAPEGPLLPNLTPIFTLTAVGLPVDVRPLRFTLYITRNSTGDSPYEQSVTTSLTSDSTATTFLPALLPSATTIYWKARVFLPDGRFFESAISSPRRTQKWLTLIEPAPSGGGRDSTRKPTFIWQSGKLDPAYGRWSYEFRVLDDDATKVSATLSDTTLTIVQDKALEANTLYRWQVKATVIKSGESGLGESVTERTPATFQIVDPALPTTTLLYQNFPNPFPSPNSFSTCFWFDVGSGGAQVTLDILDLRGTLVKSIQPGKFFSAGRYGVGAARSGSNCDNEFTWNGTSSNGQTVPAGVYLVRLKAGKRVLTKKILFRGR